MMKTWRIVGFVWGSPFLQLSTKSALFGVLVGMLFIIFINKDGVVFLLRKSVFSMSNSFAIFQSSLI